MVDPGVGKVSLSNLFNTKITSPEVRNNMSTGFNESASNNKRVNMRKYEQMKNNNHNAQVRVNT